MERDAPQPATDASQDFGFECVVAGEVEAVTKDSVRGGAGWVFRRWFSGSAGAGGALEGGYGALLRWSARWRVSDCRSCDLRKDVGSAGMGVRLLFEEKEGSAFTGKITASVAALLAGAETAVNQMGEDGLELDERS
jgi:hypothetical protein